MNEHDHLSDSVLPELWQKVSEGRAPSDAKRWLVKQLKRRPELLARDHCEGFLRLLDDPDVDPVALTRAGWALAAAEGLLSAEAGFGAMAERLEEEPLALSLLTASYVNLLEAELSLTAL